MFNAWFPQNMTTLRKLIWLRKINGGGGSSDPLNTFTGAIVRFLAKKAKPIVKLEANFTPIQDLNGQEAPYPPGGGKNLLDPAYRANLTQNIRLYYGSTGILLKANTAYTFSVSSPSAQNTILEIGGSQLTANYGKDSLTYTPESDVYVWIDAYYAGNYPAPSGGTAAVNCQLEVGSTATAWTPYSNICPISGHTGCEVVRDGKNLFDISSYPLESGYVDGNAGVAYSGSYQHSPFFPCDEIAGQTVTLNKRPGGNAPGVAFYSNNSESSFISGIRNSGGTANTPFPFTIPENASYLRFSVPSSETEIQLELGSTASEYEAYQGTSVSISFGTTVYGGTLTVNEDGSGQVVADSELEVFNTVEDNTLKSQLNFFNTAVTGVGTIGDYTRIAFAVRPDVDQSKYNRSSNTYAYTMCNMAKHLFSYNNESTHWYRNTVLYVFLPTSLVGSTVQSVFDYLLSIKDTTPLSSWIPLATPITIPVTAQQINTLAGTNTIWVNDATGDITVQAYGTAIT